MHKIELSLFLTFVDIIEANLTESRSYGVIPVLGRPETPGLQTKSRPARGSSASISPTRAVVMKA
jgi:hypothetical protein